MIRRGIAALAIVALVFVVVVEFFRPVYGSFNNSPQKSAAAQIKNFMTAIVSYRLRHNEMPRSLENLLPFMDATKPPLDPWGHPYRYVRGGDEGFVIVSYGADGRPGGEDENMDIRSDNLQAIN